MTIPRQTPGGWGDGGWLPRDTSRPPGEALALRSDAGARRKGRRRLRGARPRARGALALAARGALVRDRGRAREEEPCRLRTPFQRDRDRIVHSKPFRRLKGKTQVFIDPRRRPLPHAHDAHARDDRDLARRRARAAAERGPRRGDRARPRPRAHAVRARRRGGARRARCSERFGRRFRHNEQSLRIVDVLERRAEPDRRCATGSSRTPGPSRAGDARGQDRPDRRPGRLHQPRHRRRDPLRDLSSRRSCRARRSSCSARRARSGSTRSSTTSSRPPSAAGDIRQSEEIGDAMLALRTFMFERVYLGPHTEARARACTRSGRADLRAPRSTRTAPARATSDSGSPTTSPA